MRILSAVVVFLTVSNLFSERLNAANTTAAQRNDSYTNFRHLPGGDLSNGRQQDIKNELHKLRAQKEEVIMSAKLKKMFQNATSTLKKNNGQGLVEYALILALIAIVVLTALSSIGTNSNEKFEEISEAIETAK